MPAEAGELAPLSASQTRTVWSSDPLTMRRPSGERHALDPVLVPAEAGQLDAACASQTRTVWSSDPLTMRRPSGEYATLLTVGSHARGGRRARRPVCASQTRTVLSHDPLTMRRPSGETPRSDPVLVPAEAGELDAAGRVPDPHRLVPRPADDAAAVGGNATLLTLTPHVRGGRRAPRRCPRPTPAPSGHPTR